MLIFVFRFASLHNFWQFCLFFCRCFDVVWFLILPKLHKTWWFCRKAWDEVRFIWSTNFSHHFVSLTRVIQIMAIFVIAVFRTMMVTTVQAVLDILNYINFATMMTVFIIWWKWGWWRLLIVKLMISSHLHLHVAIMEYFEQIDAQKMNNYMLSKKLRDLTKWPKAEHLALKCVHLTDFVVWLEIIKSWFVFCFFFKQKYFCNCFCWWWHHECNSIFVDGNLCHFWTDGESLIHKLQGLLIDRGCRE